MFSVILLGVKLRKIEELHSHVEVLPYVNPKSLEKQVGSNDNFGFKFCLIVLIANEPFLILKMMHFLSFYQTDNNRLWKI